MATGICGDAELCKRVFFFFFFFFSCGRSRNRNETCKTASSPKSHLSISLSRVQNAVTSDRTTDGRTDGLSDWLDDNEAASGDFAAELIFYSRSARPPTDTLPTPFLLGWRLRARDRWAANLGLGIRITASAKNGGCRKGVGKISSWFIGSGI